MSLSTARFFVGHWLFVDNSVLSIKEKRRRDRRIPRVALKKYGESPFKYLYNSCNDQALLNITATDHAVFKELLALFEPNFNKYMMDDNSNIRRVKCTRNGKRKGRKRDIDAVGCLALVLFWYRTRGSSARGLSMPFGLTGTRLYVWLRFGRRVLLYSLQHVEGAKVRLPTNDEVAKFRRAISNKYPVLTDVWAA